MKNEDVIVNYASGYSSSAGNVRGEGNKLYSYNTCIAQRMGPDIIINMTYYSNTTSRHRNMLLKYLTRYIPKKIYIDNVPIGTQDLREYVHIRML